jgi:hypothetical protein
MVSKLRLIQHCAEFQPLAKVDSIPRGTRGIYALLKRRGRKKKVTGGTKFDVVYIGMSRTGMRNRLRYHVVRKSGLWTHFSIYAVWPTLASHLTYSLESHRSFRRQANSPIRSPETISVAIL